MEVADKNTSTSFDLNTFTLMKGYKLYRHHLANNFIHERIWRKVHRPIYIYFITWIVLSLLVNLKYYFNYKNGAVFLGNSFDIAYNLISGFFELLIFFILPFLYVKRTVHSLWHNDSLLKSSPINNETLFMGIMTPIIHFFSCTVLLKHFCMYQLYCLNHFWLQRIPTSMPSNF